MKLLSQPEPCWAGRPRLDGRIIDCGFSLLGLRAIPRGQVAVLRWWTVGFLAGLGVGPLGRYRGGSGGDVGRRWRWRPGWEFFEGDGADSTAVRGAVPPSFGRPCDQAGRAPAVQRVRVEGAPDSGHRQSADLPVAQQRRVIVQCVVSLLFSRDTTHSQRHCRCETRCWGLEPSLAPYVLGSRAIRHQRNIN